MYWVVYQRYIVSVRINKVTDKVSFTYNVITKGEGGFGMTLM